MSQSNQNPHHDPDDDLPLQNYQDDFSIDDTEDDPLLGDEDELAEVYGYRNDELDDELRRELRRYRLEDGLYDEEEDDVET